METKAGAVGELMPFAAQLGIVWEETSPDRVVATVWPPSVGKMASGRAGLATAVVHVGRDPARWRVRG
jgi:hypothetical protein